MADFLNTSLSGLLSFQRALGTTSHNISNVNTEGFSRQRVNLASIPADNRNALGVGRGVRVAEVSRNFNQFQVDAVRNGMAEQSRLTAFSGIANELDSLLADVDSGLSPALQGFYNGLQTVADDPSSVTARQALLGQAGILTDRLHTLGERFDNTEHAINQRVEGATQQINALAASVAKLNATVLESGSSANGAPPADLLDQRDLALQEIAELISVEIVDQSDGTINVFVGNGQALVLGNEANELVVGSGPYGSATTEISLQSISGTVAISSSVTGGEIGGLLDAKRELIDPSRNALGRLAAALTASANEAHSQGIDLNGELGSDFFQIGQPDVHDNQTNIGTATLDVAIADVSALTTSDYQLTMVSGQPTLFRLDTGEQVLMTGAGISTDPFVADGMTIDIVGAPPNGDSFLIRPSANLAGKIDLAITDGTKIAAASPIRQSAAVSNIGQATASNLLVTDVSDPALTSNVTIEFIDSATYSVNGSGSFSYTSGDTVNANGWQLEINGTPAAGDQFSVGANAGGFGDNQNALNMASVFDGGVLNGGTTSLRDDYSGLIAKVSTTTRQADINLVAQESITAQLVADREATSGVNLDEEAANMLKFQQAYQAAAQMIGVADQLFQTLIGAVRR